MNLKKLLSLIAVVIMLATGCIVYAEPIATPLTKTELRTGVIFIWKNTAGVWQYKMEPSKPYRKTEPTTEDIKSLYPGNVIRNIVVNPYNGEDLISVDWYPNQIASDTQSYQRFYWRNAISNLATHNLSDDQEGVMSYTYSGTLTAQDGTAVDIKYYLAQDMADEVYAMLGVTRNTAPAEIKRAMEELYPAGGQSANVEGYLYFVPILRQYEILPAARPLKKPLVDVECGDPVTPGSSIQVGGVIKNPNDYDVRMTYTLSVNGVTLKTDTLTLKTGKGYGAYAPYKVSAKAKAGSKLHVVLTATIWDPLDPAKKASASDSCDRYIVLDDTDFDGGLQPSEIVD